MSLGRLAAACWVAGLAWLAVGCAREGAPPGGPIDRRPPVLLRTVPDTFAVVHDFRGPVRFVFDERISEKLGGGVQDLDHAVLVSPRTAQVRVSHDRHGISVRLEGGFKPDLVYRVTVLPVLRDLFNNQMLDPIDLVFSTGARFDTTALAGLVWDRLTGAGLSSAVVQAVSDSDSLVYQAETDSGGVYAFRYLPAGHYRLVAFQDQNRNDSADFREPQGVRSVALGAEDTVLVNVAALRPDTTPARLTGATALDSVTVAARFDDYLDPTVPVTRIALKILRPDSTPGPGVARLYQESAYDAYVAQVQDSFARLDSVANAAAMARRAAGDTTPVPASPARRGPPSLPVLAGTGGGVSRTVSRAVSRGGGRRTLLPNGQPPPGRRLVALLNSPLVAGTKYTLEVSGVVDINELPGGGGSTSLVSTPDTTKTDTTKADTLRGDTLRSKGPDRRDTTRLVPVLRVPPHQGPG